VEYSVSLSPHQGWPIDDESITSTRAPTPERSAIRAVAAFFRLRQMGCFGKWARDHDRNLRRSHSELRYRMRPSEFHRSTGTRLRQNPLVVAGISDVLRISPPARHPRTKHLSSPPNGLLRKMGAGSCRNLRLSHPTARHCQWPSPLQEHASGGNLWMSLTSSEVFPHFRGAQLHAAPTARPPRTRRPSASIGFGAGS